MEIPGKAPSCSRVHKQGSTTCDMVGVGGTMGVGDLVSDGFWVQIPEEKHPLVARHRISHHLRGTIFRLQNWLSSMRNKYARKIQKSQEG